MKWFTVTIEKKYEVPVFADDTDDAQEVAEDIYGEEHEVSCSSYAEEEVNQTEEKLK